MNSNAITCHDITINCANNSSIYITGGNGSAGAAVWGLGKTFPLRELLPYIKW